MNLDEIAHLVHPDSGMPDDLAQKVGIDPQRLARRRARDAAERQAFAAELAAAAGGGEDLLLYALWTTAEELEVLDARRRRLIAYAREWVSPRPYTLEDLAEASGMSISGVRTAYGAAERETVTTILGRLGRPGTPAAYPAGTDPGPTRTTEADQGNQSEAAPAREGFDPAAIAAELRALATEADGEAYLDGLGLDRAGLLAVAGELLLTRVDRLTKPQLKQRLLKQAIGSRRKYDGLRTW